MSFGYSVGDIIALTQLVRDTRQRFISAPREFEEISNHMKILSTVLQDIEEFTEGGQRLTNDQENHLHAISRGCFEVLGDLQGVLDKFQELGEEPNDKSTRPWGRAWKRLRWDQKEISSFSERIQRSLGAYNLFLTGLISNLALDAKLAATKADGRHNDQERDDILRWITSKNYAIELNDVLRQRQKGTGRWFLNATEFQDWVTGEQMTLFCPGIPGAGKTVMSATIIDYLEGAFHPISISRASPGASAESAVVGIAYIFCNFRRHDEQGFLNLLSSLLKQLVQQLDEIPTDIKLLYKRYKDRGQHMTEVQTLTILNAVCSQFSRIFFLVDALDECQSSHTVQCQLVTELFDLQKQYNVNILATSRFIPDLMSLFDGCPSLEVLAADEDVQKYLLGHMADLPAWVSKDAKLQAEIVEQITRLVNGMFLLARLHFSSLKGKRSPKAIRAALKGLSTGSDAYQYAYEEAMRRVLGQLPDEQEVARDLMSWICCAERPLTSPELQHALAVEVDQSYLDEDNLSEMDWMISLCAGLVVHDQESDVVRLVHYTTQEYFQKEWRKWFPNAYSYTTIACLSYLSFDVFDGICSNYESLTARLKDNCFFKYCALEWASHVRKLENELLPPGDKETIDAMVLRFLTSKGPLLATWQVCLYDWSFEGYDQPISEDVTGHHLTAYLGLETSMKLLISNGINADQRDTYGRTPLAWAAIRGHVAVAKLLIELGVSLNSIDLDGRTALIHAARNGHLLIVSQLLEALADPECEDADGWNALLWASHLGHDHVVKQLLCHNAKRDPQGTYNGVSGRTPLSFAASGGFVKVVDLLLAKGADPNLKDDLGRAPLSWASKIGHTAVVLRLIKGTTQDGSLEEKADSSTDDGGCRICEFPLAPRGEKSSPRLKARDPHTVIIPGLMPNRSIDIDFQDKNGHSPLYLAARNGWAEVGSILLSHGARGDCRDKDGRTPLFVSMQNCHLEFAALLLRENPNAGILGDDEQQLAPGVEMGIFEALLRSLHELLGTYALPGQDSGNVEWHDPSRRAQIERDDAILLRLVQAKQKSSGLTTEQARILLLASAKFCYLETVKFLVLECTIDLECRDQWGRTPLSLAMVGGNEEIGQVLLAKGANPDTRDLKGRSPLSWAASYNNIAFVIGEFLVKAEVDINSADSRGITPLSYASVINKFRFVRLLLEKGADPNRVDERGRSALLWAVQPYSDGIIGWCPQNFLQWDIPLDGALDTARYLLEGGADPDVKDVNGETPLLTICRSNAYRPDTTRLLLERGVDANSRDLGGRTALSLASENGNLPVVKVLVENGAQINIRDDQDGKSALFKLDGEGNDAADLSEFLIERGANVDQTDHHGRTALADAAERGDQKLVAILAQHGADVEIRDHSSQTPLDLAAANGHWGVVNILQQNGVDLGILDGEQRTRFEKWKDT